MRGIGSVASNNIPEESGRKVIRPHTTFHNFFLWNLKNRVVEHEIEQLLYDHNQDKLGQFFDDPIPPLSIHLTF